ncbi:MAG: pyridoxamine 5'-phosphate oxidase [Planctomycetes bacterium]|jgi:pyridoxamine 5'-phosphate oxidase|nr:pyridoxamine 5'-phosphate oxidase [Planctomycetota bacterium]
MSLLAKIRCVWTMGRGVARGLPDAAARRDPMELFDEWFAAAREAGIFLPESMCLSTATPDGQPSSRMVLLKGHGREGFDFYTNYESRKAVEIEANARVALCFHWAVLERQVRVEGVAERLPSDVSKRYFDSRPRGSRIGAWASKQSRTLPERAELEQRVKQYEQQFSGGGGAVPLPEYWGGYRVRPTTIEFWQGRADRLHDRLVFERDGEGWATRRLYP